MTDIPLGKEKISGMGSSWLQFARRTGGFCDGAAVEVNIPCCGTGLGSIVHPLLKFETACD